MSTDSIGSDISGRRVGNATGTQDQDRSRKARLEFPLLVFEDVFEAERQIIRPPGPLEPNPIVGISLSGGGIRSAAFSLGALQAIGARRVFERIDYLSTVSGGGYTGSAMIAAMTRDAAGGGGFPFSQAAVRPDELNATDISDNDVVKGIRNRCRYLMPNGIFDLIVSLAIIARGLAVNAVFVLVSVFFLASITLYFNPTKSSLEREWVFEHLSPSFSEYVETHIGRQLLFTKVGLTGFVVWLVCWAIYRSLQPLRQKNTRLSDPGSPPAKYSAIAMIGLAAIFITELQAPILRLIGGTGADHGGGIVFRFVWDYLRAIAIFLTVGTGAFAVTWRWFVGMIREASKDNSYAALAKTMFSRVMLFLLAMALPTLIYLTYLTFVIVAINNHDDSSDKGALIGVATEAIPWMIGTPLAFISALIIWNFCFGPPQDTLLDMSWWAQGWNTTAVEGRANRNIFHSRAAAIAMVAFFLILMALTVLCCSRFYGNHRQLLDQNRGFLSYLGFGLVGLCAVGLFSANANSLNRLYRDRLDEAFELGNVKRYEGGRKQMALHTEQGLKLSDLNRPNVQSTRFRPYPIINAAMNMEGSSTEGHRSADFFIFTPDHIGCNSTGYVNTRLFEQERGGEPSLDLATATAISGAAVSSQMGQVGIPILAPTLALLNIRLGYWARNPSFFARGEFASRIRDWKIFYLFAEMFGRPSERNNKVYLTDGGHIDNLGVYQLLKRKCDVIIVVDAEADPAMTFGSLVDVERFARIDMGIRIELPFPLTAEAVSKRKAALKAGEHPTPRCGDWNHAVVGRILYPGRKDGLLLYIKAAVTGDEASYVLDYERRFPSFPHESTGDQFFTEEQFESYRALGFHAMDAGLRQTDGSDLWTNTLIEIRKKLGLSVNVEAIHSNPPVQAV